MNILPKKRWHVRTKSNIERVRKDEAEALEREQKEKRRIQVAEQEARIDFLKRKGTETHPSSNLAAGFLGNVENSIGGTNKEHEEEKRADQEKIEKNIGLLTYLGQSSKEEKPWYMVPKKRKVGDEEGTDFSIKRKIPAHLDPLNDMKKYLSMKEKHQKKTSNSSGKKSSTSSKSSVKHTDQKNNCKSIEELRAARLEREKIEKERARQLLLRLKHGHK